MKNNSQQKTLTLSLIRKWFEMTKSGIKKEDYREITPYWCNRFLFFKAESKSKEFWENEFFKVDCESADNLILKYIERGIVSFKNFSTNKMTLGYPKSEDTERIVNLEHLGIEIRTGNEEWGAEPNKLYFVVKHGNTLDQ
jgi:hypothetical protein